MGRNIEYLSAMDVYPVWPLLTDALSIVGSFASVIGLVIALRTLRKK